MTTSSTVAFVTGGSGFLGRNLIRALVADGFAVRALVRSPKARAAVEQRGARAIDGDLAGSDGVVDNVRASEVRRFAYPIQKQNEGVYVVVNARFKPEFTSELDRYFKIEESILRHMMLKEDR